MSVTASIFAIDRTGESSDCLGVYPAPDHKQALELTASHIKYTIEQGSYDAARTTHFEIVLEES